MSETAGPLPKSFPIPNDNISSNFEDAWRWRIEEGILEGRPRKHNSWYARIRGAAMLLVGLAITTVGVVGGIFPPRPGKGPWGHDWIIALVLIPFGIAVCGFGTWMLVRKPTQMRFSAGRLQWQDGGNHGQLALTGPIAFVRQPVHWGRRKIGEWSIEVTAMGKATQVAVMQNEQRARILANQIASVTGLGLKEEVRANVDLRSAMREARMTKFRKVS